nr:MAG TPA: hypothetical protein [Caudoviricetes sp.]
MVLKNVNYINFLFGLLIKRIIAVMPHNSYYCSTHKNS